MPEPREKTRPKNQLATHVYATRYVRKLMLANVCNGVAAVAFARQMTEVMLPRFVMVRRKRPTIRKQVAAEPQQQQPQKQHTSSDLEGLSNIVSSPSVSWIELWELSWD